MPSLTVRNIPKRDHAELLQDARQNRRTVNAEILKLLADKAEMNRQQRHAAKVMRRIDKIREEIARGYPDQPDSAELIREDRDTR